MTNILVIDDNCEICGDKMQSMHLIKDCDRAALSLLGYLKRDGVAVIQCGALYYVNCKNCVEKISNG